MPFRLGALGYPAMVLAIHLSKPRAVGVFEEAGAYGPDSARRPESLSAPRKGVAKAVRKGLLVRTDDGRYYVDRAAVRRADRRNLVWMLLALAAFAPVLWLIW